jgi:hypothetical protein
MLMYALCRGDTEAGVGMVRFPPPPVVSVPLFKQKSEEQKVEYAARYRWNGEQASNFFQEKERLIMQNFLGTMKSGYITIIFRGEKYSVRKNDESRIHNYKMNSTEGKHNIRPRLFPERDRESYNISCCLCEIKELIFIV